MFIYMLKNDCRNIHEILTSYLQVVRLWIFFISLCFSEEFDSFVISMNYFYIRIAKKVHSILGENVI